MIIDSPVFPGSPRKDLEAWIEELQKIRAQHRGNLDALQSIDRSLEEARHWLKLQSPAG